MSAIRAVVVEASGYQTPYFGKWHLSYDVANLKDYGYTSFTPNQDYVGYAGEGQGTDDAPAYEAAHWDNDYVRNAKSKANSQPAYVPQPFFLTLNFVNPHDKQWFWGGMQADDFYEVYNGVHKKYPTEVAPGPYIEIFPGPVCASTACASTLTFFYNRNSLPPSQVQG